MTTRTRGARFCQNNLAAAEGATLTVSSAANQFPGSNTLDSQRWTRWATNGNFRIHDLNNKLYVNDGSDKTVTLTNGSYTGVTLATHIQTKLNDASTNWTVSYDGDTYKFTVGRSTGDAVLRLSESTNAVWDSIGYTGLEDDDVGTGQVADEPRIHTSERWRVDLGTAKQCRAFFVISGADDEFPISSSAVMTLKASNIEANLDPAGDPPLNVSLTREATGVFQFLDHLESSTYRYWEWEFSDPMNPNGPVFAIHNVYLGDYVTPLTRNISNGFMRQIVDPSIKARSQRGVQFYSRRPKYWEFRNTTFEFLKDSDRTELERVFGEMGTTTPFFVSLDPLVDVTASLGEATKYVVFDPDLPSITHIRRDYYRIAINMREEVG